MSRKDILEQKENFKQWALEGKNRKQIAELLKCSVTTVDKYASLFNIEITKQKKLSKYADITGQIFNQSQLEVLERDYEPQFKSHETAYKCKCLICGEIKTYRKSNIVNGPGCHKCSGKKCGRGYKEWEIGQKFGYLTIIDKGKSPEYVKCQCECGVVKDIKIQHLKGHNHSRTISCGCKQQSSGELKIQENLIKFNINYKEQYKIKDLSEFMSFDFAIFDNNNNLIKLIEFDGKQHFEAIEYFGGEEKFKTQQERDNRKNEYCRQNNINLLRIPYYEFDLIDIDYLFSDIPNLKSIQRESGPDKTE